MARLPARTLSDAPLADAFDEPGCPICRRIGRASDRYLDGVLYERVNDVGFRRELDVARGFCPWHVREVLAANRRGSGGTLSAAILFRAILAVRRRELEAVRRPAGGLVRSGRPRPRACPTARPATSGRTEADAVESVVRLSADPTWAEALATAPLCLAHLLALMAAAGRSPVWERIEAGQAERLWYLEATLDAFAHHSAEDRAELMTEEEVASADEAARVLAGSTR